MEGSEIDPSTLKIIGGALLAAIGALWRSQQSSNKKGEKRHEEALEDNKRQQSDLLKLTDEVGELRGKVHLTKELGENILTIKYVTEQTLDELKK